MTTVLGTPATQPLHRALGLTDFEYQEVCGRLGREPNHLELAMFSVMWSEHCSYKSSRPLLATLPTGGADVAAGPGENAGVVRIGGGLAVAFKLESHNHPSAVEPYQGAATGVGGILRDIFAMGARPIAVLDALKFGDLAEPRTQHLVRGVVSGVGGYGNCVGVPTVGGELTFDAAYHGNPLVNVMAVGLLEERHLMRATAPGPGNLAVLFGSPTGRDGIGGASVLASATFDETSAERRPSVQIGDPFAEKLLIEASLELVAAGLVEGLQDLGAAGITCAVSETTDRAGTGMIVYLDAIPLREPGMEPWEVMISESQERMLAIVRPDLLDDVLEVCQRWGLPAAVIGRVTDDGDVTIVTGALSTSGDARGPGPDGRPLDPAAGGAAVEELARIPARALTSDAIVHQRERRAPLRSRPAPAPGIPESGHDALPERGMDAGSVLLALLATPNLGSRAWVTSQYDATVGANTVEGAAHGAAVLRVRGTDQGLVMATDACAHVAVRDPWLGAALAVAECTRNVSITGARPLGITNCLNFGDPERPEAFWQLAESVRGIADACRALGLPVTGGNVSLYNESPDGAILPTAQIGVVGLLDDLEAVVRPGFRNPGDLVCLVGEAAPGLIGSHYSLLAGEAADDRLPSLDLAREAALQDFLRAAAAEGLLVSAQDVSGGGLAVALSEAAIWGDLGADLDLTVNTTPAVELFGESPSRVIVTLRPETWEAVTTLTAERHLPITRLGTVGGDRLQVRLVGLNATGVAEERGVGLADAIDIRVAELRHAWASALPRALGEDA